MSKPAKKGGSGGNITRPPAAPVIVTQAPDPAAWQEALIRADGNARRLEVLDARTVLVHNHEQR